MEWIRVRRLSGFDNPYISSVYLDIVATLDTVSNPDRHEKEE